MTSIIDLHMHSNQSDGFYTPADLVKLAYDAGLRTIAITDHDNMDAVRPAQEAAKALPGMEVIPGVEISVIWNHHSIEILGYGFDLDDPVLNDLLNMKKERRISRVRRTVEKLAALNVNVSFERVMELGGEGSVGRPHVAQALVEAGYVKDTREAFDVYLGSSKPGYVSGGADTSLQEGIDAVHHARGLAVTAHPILPDVPDYLDLEKYVPDAAAAGIDGIEGYYSEWTEENIRTIAEIAAQHNWLRTGGSDFHGGDINPHLRLGQVHVPDEVLVEMRRRLGK